MTQGPGLEVKLSWVDVAKAVAAQLIVWHHLTLYGPMADVAWPLAPSWFAWLAGDARIAVQVFLVVAGFLAARQLAPDRRLLLQHVVLPSIVRRYLRLMLPYVVVLVFAVMAEAIARQWVTHASIPEPATWLQGLAHLTLLQDVLNIPALSAGVWYIAIDFQLYAVLLLLLAATRGTTSPRAGVWAVAVLMVLSLGFFNRHGDWDAYAIYFFGAYGLGVMSAWWIQAQRPWWPLGLAVAGVGLALWIEWRTRIAVAALVALGLACLADKPWKDGAASSIAAYLAGTSYALFLVHFPVALLVNAAFTHWAPAKPGVQALGLLMAWALSMLAAQALHHGVERPALRWVGKGAGSHPAPWHSRL